ncbi:MAG: oxidoreductase [Coriobacteriia bacterium]|nr:oxidoreductase [Coriobacteriia bacterium]
MAQKYALLVDYTFYSGNHAAEIACKEELGLPLDLYGIKEVEVGPFRLDDSDYGDGWDWNYIPVPTSIFSEHWGTDGDKAGQRPLACQVDESASMYYGTLEEMQAKMAEFDRPMVLFQL